MVGWSCRFGFARVVAGVCQESDFGPIAGIAGGRTLQIVGQIHLGFHQGLSERGWRVLCVVVTFVDVKFVGSRSTSSLAITVRVQMGLILGRICSRGWCEVSIGAQSRAVDGFTEG